MRTTHVRQKGLLGHRAKFCPDRPTYAAVHKTQQTDRHFDLYIRLALNLHKMKINVASLFEHFNIYRSTPSAWRCPDVTAHQHSVCRYFRHGKLYGLACFANMSVASAAERGARMKSVGILATSYTLLYRHMQFLETQVR